MILVVVDAVMVAGLVCSACLAVIAVGSLGVGIIMRAATGSRLQKVVR